MVTLKRMNEVEFQAFHDLAVRGYAEEKVRAGNWEEEGSLQKSIEEFARLLPAGVHSESNYLYVIRNKDNENVGTIWLAKQNPEKAFIYDIRIYDDQQGKGYGKGAMKRIEEEARQIGVTKIGLHVFGHNIGARRLYEKIGYETTNVVMEKEI